MSQEKDSEVVEADKTPTPTSEVEPTEERGLPLRVIMRNAWLAMLLMFIVDKVLHLVIPPLPEYWYGMFLGIAVSGKIIDMTRKS